MTIIREQENLIFSRLKALMSKVDETTDTINSKKGFGLFRARSVLVTMLHNMTQEMNILKNSIQEDGSIRLKLASVKREFNSRLVTIFVFILYSFIAFYIAFKINDYLRSSIANLKLQKKEFLLQLERLAKKTDKNSVYLFTQYKKDISKFEKSITASIKQQLYVNITLFVTGIILFLIMIYLINGLS